MSEEKNYKYYAFISYSSKNEKYAKWLQKKLESYKLPTVLQKQYNNLNIPKKIKVFRDNTDISCGGTVENALLNELEDSQNLIVICSPESAKSVYVEYEIESFIKLGRSLSNIFPFIIEGIIDEKNKEKDCFTSLLHQNNLNAVDITKDGRHDAFIRLLSSLLMIKYDDIKRRDVVQQRRKYSIFSFCAICSIVFLCLLFNFTVPKTKYFSDYVTYWGVPKGLFPLTAKQIKPLAEHYEITYQFNKPIKLVHANSAHIPIPETEDLERFNRPMIAEYIYKEKLSLSKDIKDWQLLESKYTTQTLVLDSFPRNNVTILDYNSVLDENGNNTNMMTVDFRYGYGDHVGKALSNDFLASTNIYNTDITQIINGEPEKQLLEQTSAIYRYQITYAQDGLEKEVRFCNKAGQSVSDKNSIIGFFCEYEPDGRLCKTDFIYNENVNNKFESIKSVVYTYSDNHLISIEYKKDSSFFDDLNELGQPMQNTPTKDAKLMMNSSRKIASKAIKYYDSGNIKTISCFDDKGQSAFVFPIGYSELTYTYDENTGFSLTNKVIMKDCIWFIEGICDKDGNPIEQTMYVDDLFNSKTLWTFDNKQRITNLKSFDKENNLEQNIHIEYMNTKEIMTVFDSSGNEKDENITNLMIQTFDINKRLISEYFELPSQKLSLTGEISYDGENRTIHKFFNNTPYIETNSFITYSSAEFTYDATGNLLRVLFKDEEGDPFLSNLGFSEYMASYSPSGLKLREYYLEPNNYLAANPKFSGYSEYEALNDLSDTYLKRGRYCNSNGELTNPRNQEWSWFFTNYPDNESRVTTYYYSDNRVYKTITYQNEKIISNAYYQYEENGDYSVISSDEKNRLVSSVYYDAKGNLKKKTDNSYSKRIVTYTTDGAHEVSDFDQDEKLVSIMFYNKDLKKYKYKKIENDGSFTLVYLDDNERFSKIENFFSDNFLQNQVIFEYTTDNSYTMKEEDFIKKTKFISFYSKENIPTENEQGYFCMGESFDLNGIKRTICLNKNNQTMLALSGKVISVTQVVPNSQAEKLGFLIGDVVLEYGDYKYFSKQTQNDFIIALSNYRDKKKTIAIYRPSEKKIVSFDCESGSVGIELSPDYPFSTGDECLAYIAQIKTKYNENF